MTTDTHKGIGQWPCLLYTSDAADERSSVDLGGRRIIKKKKTEKQQKNTKKQQTKCRTNSTHSNTTSESQNAPATTPSGPVACRCRTYNTT